MKTKLFESLSNHIIGHGLHVRGLGGKPQLNVALATTEQIPGRTIKEYKGMAIGSTVRTKDMTKDITSTVRSVFGGELPHYTQLMADTREEAIVRLQEYA